MSDSKKVGKKFSTIFWWLLTIAPFITLIFAFVGAVINIGFSNGSAHLDASDYLSYINGTFNDYELYNWCFNMWDNFSIPNLRNAFENLFDILGISENSLIAYAFGFMVSVQVYHLIFDIICWLPKQAHNLMD